MDVDHVVQLLLSEWQSLREESTAAIERRVTVTSWGTAAYGGLASACAWLLGAGNSYEAVAFWLICVGLPFQALSVATLWAGEAKRGDRAGRYMEAIEADLQSLLICETSNPALSAWLTVGHRRPLHALGWETFLRMKVRNGGWFGTPQLEIPYLAQAAYFFTMVAVPPFVAWQFASTRWGQDHPTPYHVAIVAVAWLMCLLTWVVLSSPVASADSKPAPKKVA